MSGLTIAPYYGCQCLRPFSVFDDPEDPHSMDGLIKATGADLLEWDMGAQCCGASNTTTKPEAGMELVGRILKAAQGADAILTVCPMCQMNLESSQKKISHKQGIELDIPVLFLPQFLGLAMGKIPKDVGLDLNLSNTGPLMKKAI
ncbi:MAG TPA: disulfide reductase, partial [Desulfobacterales bacterium]|nr:disulfide reductase [Desulfobacterales bacterium]